MNVKVCVFECENVCVCRIHGEVLGDQERAGDAATEAVQ